MTIRRPYKESIVIWQTDPCEDSGIAEPALLIEAYTDVVSITQRDNTVNIGIDSIDDFCRNLKKLYK